MTKFYPGQDVEVYACRAKDRTFDWRKAKISCLNLRKQNGLSDRHQVEFPDGARGVFDEEHIRAAPFENSGLNEELQKHEISKRDFAGRKGENPSWE